MAAQRARERAVLNAPGFREDIRDAVLDLQAQFGPGPVRELLELFLAESVSLLDALQAALQSGDMPGAASRAHGLKGIAGNFGTPGIVRGSTQIEKGAMAGAGEQTLLALYGEVRNETMAAREIIREFL